MSSSSSRHPNVAILPITDSDVMDIDYNFDDGEAEHIVAKAKEAEHITSEAREVVKKVGKRAEEVWKVQNYVRRLDRIRMGITVEVEKLVGLDQSGIVKEAQVAVEGWYNRKAEVSSGFAWISDFFNDLITD